MKLADIPNWVVFTPMLRCEQIWAKFRDDFDDAGLCLPALRQRTLAEERPHATGCPACPLYGVPAHLYPFAQGAAPRPEVQGPSACRLPRSDEPARHPPHFRGLLHDGDALAGGKKPRNCPLTRTRSCPARRATCSNSTSFGASCRARRRRSGCGWPFAAEPARSSPGRSGTAAHRARRTCEPPCPRITAAVPPAAMSGRRTERPFPSARIVAAPRRKGKPAMSSVGLGPCVPGSAAWCAGPTPFPSTPENHLDAIHFFIATYNLQIKQSTLV